jgi:hypothetical protein
LTIDHNIPIARRNKKINMMNRIERISHFLQLTFIVLLVLAPLMQWLGWIYIFDPGAQLNEETSHSFRQLVTSAILERAGEAPIRGEVTMRMRLLGALSAMLTTGFTMAISLQFIRLFGLYKHHQYFGHRNVLCLKRIGLFLLLREFLAPLQVALFSLILTFNNPVGYRCVSVSISGMNLLGCVVGLMTLVIAWIMDEGRKLQEEQDLTV